MYIIVARVWRRLEKPYGECTDYPLKTLTQGISRGCQPPQPISWDLIFLLKAISGTQDIVSPPLFSNLDSITLTSGLWTLTWNYICGDFTMSPWCLRYQLVKFRSRNHQTILVLTDMTIWVLSDVFDKFNFTKVVFGSYL